MDRRADFLGSFPFLDAPAKNFLHYFLERSAMILGLFAKVPFQFIVEVANRDAGHDALRNFIPQPQIS